MAATHQRVVPRFARAVRATLFLTLLSVQALVAATFTNFPAADTVLLELFPSNNLGAEPLLAAGRTVEGRVTRTLLRFVLTNLPPGAVVESAHLEVEVTRRPFNDQTPPVASHFALHRLARPWGEGDKSGSLGSAASNDEATWLAANSPANLWSQPGAAAPDDFAAVPSAVSATPIDELGRYLFASSAGLVTDVQSWVDAPAGNHGWLLLSLGEATNATARRIGSRESATPAALVVTAALPAAQITAVGRTNGLLRLTVRLPAGQPAVLERRTNLLAGGWSPFTNFPAPPAPTNVVLDDALAPDAARYYRLIPPP